MVSCTPQDNGRFRVILSATLFNPQSSGQPSDKGTIGTVNMIQAIQEGDDVIHITDGPVAEGQVHISVDAEIRRIHTRYHSAGHIIGVAFHRELLTTLLDKKDSLIFQHTKKAILVSTNTTLVDIIVAMEKEKYSQAIILDGQEEPIGILSKKDIYLLLTKRDQ